MPQAKLAIAILLFAISTGLTALAQQNPAPILPPAKITSQNPLGLTIDHTTISVKDIDKEEAFYKIMFGFQQISSGNFGPDVKFRSLAIPSVFRIDLVQHAGSARHSPTGAFDMEQGWVHIVFKTTDIAAAYKQLLAKNANMRLTKAKDGALTEIYITDPEGNEIEIQL